MGFALLFASSYFSTLTPQGGSQNIIFAASGYLTQRELYRLGLITTVFCTVVFLVIGITCIKPYFYAQTSDDAIALQGIRYLSVCCIFSLGLFTQTMGEKLLAATGRTQLSMISQLVGAVVNIILDPIFIFG